MCVGVSLEGRSRPSTTLALQIDDDHVRGLQLFVGHAAGLDDHESAAAVQAAGVAPGQRDQARRWSWRFASQTSCFRASSISRSPASRKHQKKGLAAADRKSFRIKVPKTGLEPALP